MDRGLLIETSAVSELYENISIGEYEIPLLFTGINGVYVCVSTVENVTPDVKLYDFLKKKLGLRDGQLFLFSISDEDSGEFYDYVNGFIPMDDIYEAYENCYANHLISQSEMLHIQFETPSSFCVAVEYVLTCENYEEGADNYVAPVISEKQIEFIEKKIIDARDEPFLDGSYRIYPDGHMDVKKIVTQSVAGISTFVEKGTTYFPCMDIDANKFFLLTLFGGWFGLHKFKTGNYLKGLFYVLTFGCCGVFYVMDLLSIILGGYNYSAVSRDNIDGALKFQKRKFYSRPLKNKKLAVVLLLASLVFSFFLVTLVYMPLLENINAFASSVLSDTKFANDLANKLMLNPL